MNDDGFGRLTGVADTTQPERGQPDQGGRPRVAVQRPGVARRAAGELDSLVRAALNSVRHGLIIMDREFYVYLVTRSAAELLGITGDDAANVEPVMRLLSRSRSLDATALQTLSAVFMMSGDGEARQVLVSVPGPCGSRVIAIEVRPAKRLGWVASLEDVTQLRQTQDWLLEHASSDPVTGLWNRQHFMLMLQDRLDKPAPDDTVLLLVNLARPKAAADHPGVATGDALLRIGAGRLTTLLRGDDLLARFPAYEFAIAVSGQDKQAGGAALAERIVDALSRPYAVEGQMIAVRAHVGIARAPQDATTPETLSAAAALALSSATVSHPVCFFDPAMHEMAQRRHQLEYDLSRALANDEFELWYQPQVDLSHQCIRGFEALIRWLSPTRGLVPPADFISVAEETGLIVAIGDWVLREACREAASWPDDVAVAVNASALQFESGSFAHSVSRALLAAGLPGHRLEIEVTETLLLHEQQSVETTISDLRALNVRLVLDDFGTGYASLSQLSRFRFDKIKIDRSFISAADASSEHHAIVRSIAALGISLGIPTTAEGVETVVQLDRIRADGCNCVQGYYFSKPVPAAGVAELLHRLHHRGGAT